MPPTVSSGIRKVGFWCTVVIVYLRYSLMHEVLAAKGGANAKLLYIFAVPALACLIVSGGLGRFWSGRPCRYWLAFIFWLCLCVPLSVWKGDSATYAWSYLRTDLPVMVFLAGLPMTWKECKILLHTIAFAGITCVSFSKIFEADYGGRVGLNFSTLANPNDYAGILILALPFMCLVVMYPPKVFLPLRVMFQGLSVLAILYAFYLILASGSRGALLGLGACALYAFMRGKNALRAVLIAAVPIGVLIVFTLLPANITERLLAFTTNTATTSGQSLEAAESGAVRKRLLELSIKDTFTHPLFGVGPGEFGNYEGELVGHIGGGYSPSHNSYTEISADTGLVGIFFYLAGTFSAFLLLQRMRKLTANKPELKEITSACFLVSTSMLSYCVAIAFLNFGYFFELPAFSGLVVAMSMAINREMAGAAVPSPAPTPVRPAGLPAPVRRLRAPSVAGSGARFAERPSLLSSRPEAGKRRL